jgi:hypothetical protein
LDVFCSPCLIPAWADGFLASRGETPAMGWQPRRQGPAKWAPTRPRRASGRRRFPFWAGWLALVAGACLFQLVVSSPALRLPTRAGSGLPMRIRCLQLQRLSDPPRGADGVSGLRRPPQRRPPARRGRGRLRLRAHALINGGPLAPGRVPLGRWRRARVVGSGHRGPRCSGGVPSPSTAATWRSSRTNWRIASLRSPSSSMRSSDEGCTVAMT